MDLLLGGSLPGCLQYSTAESGACTLAPWWGLRWTRRAVVEGGHGFRWVGIRKECTQERKTLGSPSTTGARTVGMRQSRQGCGNDSQEAGGSTWPAALAFS